MKNLSRVFLIISVLFTSVLNVTAQQAKLESVLAGLGDYAAQYPQEKVYLHLDKPYYAVGDDIWFKGYVTIGNLNRLSDYSKVLYVELIGPDNVLLESKRLPIVSGISMADFQLSDTLREGNYRIRAFTNWMLNFDSDLIFDHTLAIGNAVNDNTVAKSDFVFSKGRDTKVNTTITISDGSGTTLSNRPFSYEVIIAGKEIKTGKGNSGSDGKINFDFSSSEEIAHYNGTVLLTVEDPNGQYIKKYIPIPDSRHQNSIQFLPEGGNMILNNLSKIGFKALEPSGKGIGASGEIVDDAGTLVTTFQSEYGGMGSFIFIPLPGKKYTANITFEDGSILKLDLPVAQSSGYGLTVKNDVAPTIFVQAFISDDLQSEEDLTLVVQNGGNIYHAAKNKQNKQEVLFSIPRGNLPTGVVQLTLFDQRMVPVAERTIFNFTDESLLPLSISTDKEEYRAKEKVDVTIKASNDADAIALLSMAVIDLEKVPDINLSESTILSELLLNSELKGYIERPEYYFQSTDQGQIRMKELDNLLLTQGWSKINWQSLIAEEKLTVSYPVEKGISVSGRITKPGGKTPLEKAKVTLIMSSDENMGMIDTITGADGRFAFTDLVFGDDTKFVVNARDANGSNNLDIIFDQTTRHVRTENKNSPDMLEDINGALVAYLPQSKEQFVELERKGLRQRSIQIEEVAVVATRSQKVERAKNSSNLNGPGRADQIILGEELTYGSCPTLAQCLYGRLAGVTFMGDEPFLSSAGSLSAPLPMAVVVDGVFIDGGLSIIDPYSVETIEVLKTSQYIGIYGTRGAGGVLVVTLKRGQSIPQKDLPSPGVAHIQPQPYYEAREFYVPDYGQVQGEATDRDIRTTIHWAPHIVTDEKGNATLSFYTSEGSGTYRLVLEGLDESGRLGHAVKHITVN